jgi:hypothetical protein
VLSLIALLARPTARHVEARGQEQIEQLQSCPSRCSASSTRTRISWQIAEAYKNDTNFLYLGRGANFPWARGRAQAQGNLLHPRREAIPPRDEARADRSDRQEHAGGVICPKDNAYTRFSATSPE